MGLFLSLFFSQFTFTFICLCVPPHAFINICPCVEVREQLQELVLSIHHESAEVQLQVVKVDGKYHYSLSNPASLLSVLHGFSLTFLGRFHILAVHRGNSIHQQGKHNLVVTVPVSSMVLPDVQ